MPLLTRKTIQNGVIGGVIGAAFGFVPLILLVAPLLGGGVAGYLERDDAKRGLVAGAVAGVVMAALSTVVTGVILFTRFGELPFGPETPLAGLGIAALLSFAATLGQVLVASIGGALGGLLAGTRPSEDATGERHERRWGVVVGSLVAGVLTFAVVTVVVAVVLEAFIWLSLLVALSDSLLVPPPPSSGTATSRAPPTAASTGAVSVSASSPSSSSSRYCSVASTRWASNAPSNQSRVPTSIR